MPTRYFQRDGTTGKHYRDATTGKKILAVVGAPCCCPCATCDEPSWAGSYAVVFLDNIDFDYTGADIGGTCGGTGAPGDHTAAAWDYTIPRWTYYTVNCTSVIGYGTSHPVGGGTGISTQTNGVWVRCDVIQPGVTENCKWLYVVQFYVCEAGVWNLLVIRYSKNSGTTPAGAYTFLDVPTSWAGFALGSLTKPQTITLS